MTDEVIYFKIAEMQDTLGLVAKAIRKDDNAEARRVLANHIGSANGLYDYLVLQYYENLPTVQRGSKK